MPSKPQSSKKIAEGPHSRRKDLKIVSYNCKNVKTSTKAIMEIMRENKLILLQEHWLFQAQIGLLGEIETTINYAGKGVDKYHPLPRPHQPEVMEELLYSGKMNLIVE